MNPTALKANPKKTISILTAGLLAAACLGGCCTAQTALAQFTPVPLPRKVAGKLYGTCPACSWRPTPNCPDCKAIQNMRRQQAGTPQRALWKTSRKYPEDFSPQPYH
jgi:hypothetical protein